VIESDEMPHALKALGGWLSTKGFTLADARESDSFGDRLLMWVGDCCRIRIVRDKGEWALDISGAQLTGWFDADVWRSCVDGQEPPREPRPLAAQVTFLRASLSQIEMALRTPTTIQQCLRHRNWSRLGLPGEPPSG
jgi:hypothetical protein